LRIVILFFCFFISCVKHSEPNWFFSQPQSDEYWFGIGIVEKDSNANECREVSKNLALSEISSQISVDISGSFERMVVENNLSLSDVSQSVVKIHMDNNLPKIEYVEFYDSKDKCGMLARLSQSVYYESLALQRENAIQTAIGLLEQAESKFDFQVFSLLNDAMSEIMPYMDVPIQVEYPVGSKTVINLPSYLKVLINKYINRLDIIPNDKKIEVKKGFTNDIELIIKVIDKQNNNFMQGIPVSCKIYQDLFEGVSDENGKCSFSLPLIMVDNVIHHVNYLIDKNRLIKKIDFFGDLSEIQNQTMIKIKPLLVNMNIIENNLGQLSLNPYVEPVISEFFSENFLAHFVDKENADLLINGTVNTRSVSDEPNEYGIYQVFADLTISISYGESNKEILKKSFNKIQGSDFNSNQEAANQSLKKMSHKIKEDFLPEILQGM
tara:strand:+ start:169 stop:1482 length:1314 start_codon:yes stop_codon:yes gene_type:complete